jgi:hypothetical protein
MPTGTTTVHYRYSRNMNELAGKPCSSTTAGASRGPASR